MARINTSELCHRMKNLRYSVGNINVLFCYLNFFIHIYFVFQIPAFFQEVSHALVMYDDGERRIKKTGNKIRVFVNPNDELTVRRQVNPQQPPSHLTQQQIVEEQQRMLQEYERRHQEMQQLLDQQSQHHQQQQHILDQQASDRLALLNLVQAYRTPVNTTSTFLAVKSRPPQQQQPVPGFQRFPPCPVHQCAPSSKCFICLLIVLFYFRFCNMFLTFLFVF